MNGLAIQSLGSTSAAGAMLMAKAHTPALVGLMLVGVGTNAGEPVFKSPLQLSVTTNAGATVVRSDPGEAIAELRRLSGLTWDQLARLFTVSRRALHFWASGKAMTAGNEERLLRVLAVIRKSDRGSASENRVALLSPAPDGSIPFDLLLRGDYGGAFAVLGAGGQDRIRAPKLSEAAMAARAPRPPEELVGALQDRLTPASGRRLGGKKLQLPRRK